MKNKELIKKLLEFPMDMDVYIDNHNKSPLFETNGVGLNKEKTEIWITNYR